MVATPERKQLESALVAPTEDDILSDEDIADIKHLQDFLAEPSSQHTRLIGANGETMEIPKPIYRVLRRIVPLMVRGAVLGLVPLHQELTTQQAADLLNMSRPSLIKLLDSGQIPFERSQGGHRRIHFVDVMAYKHRRSGERRAALAEIGAIGQKYGAYEVDNDDLLFGIDTNVTDSERD